MTDTTTYYECRHCGDDVYIGMNGILFGEFSNPECSNPNREDGRHELEAR